MERDSRQRAEKRWIDEQMAGEVQFFLTHIELKGHVSLLNYQNLPPPQMRDMQKEVRDLRCGSPALEFPTV